MFSTIKWTNKMFMELCDDKTKVAIEQDYQNSFSVFKQITNKQTNKQTNLISSTIDENNIKYHYQK
jgi:hypothetical protein